MANFLDIKERLFNIARVHNVRLHLKSLNVQLCSGFLQCPPGALGEFPFPAADLVANAEGVLEPPPVYRAIATVGHRATHLYVFGASSDIIACQRSICLVSHLFYQCLLCLDEHACIIRHKL